MSKIEFSDCTASLISSLQKGFYTSIHCLINHSLFNMKVIIFIDTMDFSYNVFVPLTNLPTTISTIFVTSVCKSIVKDFATGLIELGNG